MTSSHSAEVVFFGEMGSVMIEENVVSAAGTTYRTSTEELVHLIRRLGKTPVQRDTLYRDVKVWN